eukprot:GILJ01004078.1.p1 GENE.GILJ01004078.1~~GILJ01004078.1.p1  ORF type:complete len:901 (-),score=191.59 GILJ01004078.1:154-2856(-)
MSWFKHAFDKARLRADSIREKAVAKIKQVREGRGTRKVTITDEYAPMSAESLQDILEEESLCDYPLAKRTELWNKWLVHLDDSDKKYTLVSHDESEMVEPTEPLTFKQVFLRSKAFENMLVFVIRMDFDDQSRQDNGDPLTADKMTAIRETLEKILGHVMTGDRDLHTKLLDRLLKARSFGEAHCKWLCSIFNTSKRSWKEEGYATQLAELEMRAAETKEASQTVSSPSPTENSNLKAKLADVLREKESHSRLALRVLQLERDVRQLIYGCMEEKAKQEEDIKKLIEALELQTSEHMKEMEQAQTQAAETQKEIMENKNKIDKEKDDKIKELESSKVELAQTLEQLEARKHALRMELEQVSQQILSTQGAQRQVEKETESVRSTSMQNGAALTVQLAEAEHKSRQTAVELMGTRELNTLLIELSSTIPAYTSSKMEELAGTLAAGCHSYLQEVDNYLNTEKDRQQVLGKIIRFSLSEWQIQEQKLKDMTELGSNLGVAVPNDLLQEAEAIENRFNSALVDMDNLIKDVNLVEADLQVFFGDAPHSCPESVRPDLADLEVAVKGHLQEIHAEYTEVRSSTQAFVDQFQEKQRQRQEEEERLQREAAEAKAAEEEKAKQLARERAAMVAAAAAAASAGVSGSSFLHDGSYGRSPSQSFVSSPPTNPQLLVRQGSATSVVGPKSRAGSTTPPRERSRSTTPARDREAGAAEGSSQPGRTPPTLRLPAPGMLARESIPESPASKPPPPSPMYAPHSSSSDAASSSGPTVVSVSAALEKANTMPEDSPDGSPAADVISQDLSAFLAAGTATAEAADAVPAPPEEQAGAPLISMTVTNEDDIFNLSAAADGDAIAVSAAAAETETTGQFDDMFLPTLSPTASDASVVLIPSRNASSTASNDDDLLL